MVYVVRMRRFASKACCVLLVSLPWLALMAQTAQDAPQRAAALEQQVRKYLQEQKPQLAIPVLRELVSLAPDNLNAQANLGVLLYFDGNFTEAVPHLDAALRLQPGLWKIEALLGIAQKRIGNPEAAEAHLENAFSHLDEKKIQLQAGLELAELYSAAAQFDKALSVAGKLRALAPEDAQILFITYEISRQIMDQSLLSLMAAAPDSAETHMVMANQLARQGDHAASVAQYREAIRLNPALPGVHFELAEQLRTSTDPALNAQAEDEYKAAIQANRYDELSWRQLGGIMTAKGDFQQAAEDYRKALALRPRDSDAQTGLAIALISLNLTEEAIPLLESAIKDDPTNIVAHYRLSVLYRRAGRTAEAQRELETFNHYKDLKDKLGQVLKQLSGTSSPM